MKLTLLYIGPKPVAVWEEKGIHDSTLQVEKQAKLCEKKGHAAFEAARKDLLKVGFDHKQIHTRLVEASDVTKAILRETEQGRYAVVGVGRTGAGQGRIKKLFMGSVSDTLFHELEGAALWICH